ncbi:MAG: MotA/TolQ/ExbB proton channel family protein [Planctomycetota bacterium]
MISNAFESAFVALVSAAPGAISAPEVPQKTLLDYIGEGREIGFVIIILSIAGLGMAIQQLLSVRAGKLAPRSHVETLDSRLRSGDVAGAIAFCEDDANDSLLTRVFGGALVRCARSPFGFLELKSAVEEIGQQQVARLYRLTDGIGLIASIAPMLGLLGTVVGMVGAFDTISVTEGPVRPDALAGNISEALITTVLGLIVAIPATAMYTFLRNRIDHLAAEAAEIMEELAVHLEGGANAAQANAGPRSQPGAAQSVQAARPGSPA